jgi:hypothetical protein
VLFFASGAGIFKPTRRKYAQFRLLLRDPRLNQFADAAIGASVAVFPQFLNVSCDPGYLVSRAHDTVSVR